jgi:hypothetical protein
MSLTKVSYSMINGAVININDYGAIGDGSTDNTVAIQAAIDACPKGGSVFVPSGYYKFSALTSAKAVRLIGAGFNNEIQGTYGNAEWQNFNNFGGSVLISTATSGDAIYFGAASGSAGEIQNFQMSDLMIVGPGTGTSTAVHFVRGVGHYFENVLIANFNTGWNFDSCQDGTGNKIAAKSCRTGIVMGGLITSNQWVLLNPEIQRYEVFGLNLIEASLVQILGGLFQDADASAAIGINVSATATATTIKGVWFENVNIDAALNIVGGRTTVEQCYFANPVDNVKLRSAAQQTHLLHNYFGSSAPTASSLSIDAGATNNYIIDSAPSTNGTYTDLGTNTIYITTTNNIFNQQSGNRAVLGTDTINGIESGAGSATKIARKITSLVDATPKLNALAVEIPNSNQSCVIKLTALGSLGAGGAVGADEASQSVSCDIVITRTTGTNIAVTQSAYYGSAASNVAGATTCTTTVDTTLVVGAIGATQTVFIRPVVTKGGGGSDNHTVVMLAELVNSNTAGARIYKN